MEQFITENLTKISFGLTIWLFSFFSIYLFLNKKEIITIPNYQYPIAISYTLLARFIIALTAGAILATFFIFLFIK